MDPHLQFRLHDPVAGVSRAVMRLHSLDVAVREIHVRGDRLCIRLAEDSDVRRVHTVLARCVDVSADATACACRPAAPTVPRRTTYVVSCGPEPTHQVDGRRRRLPA